MPIVIKYGGSVVIPSAVEGPDPILAEVVKLHLGGTRIVLVHGGLCATINKRLVRACAALGARAVGISGEDADTLVAQTAHGSHGEDLGFVGDVTACDPSLINLLLAANYLPVVAPLAVAPDDAHAYNVNADLAAAAIAGALHARAFIMITNVERVRRDPKDPASGIDRRSLDEARAFVKTPACEGGMLPKMHAAIAAVESGAAASHICGPHSIVDALAGNATVVGGV